jgi:6-phosphogluconolactonase (cycloisomerase 2 family)
MPGNNVAVFRIAPEAGGLNLVGDPISMPKPSCIMLLP